VKELSRSFTVFVIKGPELLGKYIGSSEKAIRDLFEKARKTRPSLIVFEEIDTLAGKRGCDNTGTTDRVVNQLLTELDGVEGRRGIFIVGTTTDPNKIDNALKRSGRLEGRVDLSHYSPEDLTEILKFLLKTHHLHSYNLSDKVFEALKDKLRGLFPGDLNKLVYDCRRCKDLAELENFLLLQLQSCRKFKGKIETSAESNGNLKAGFMQ
jgi:peroxin-1